MDIEKAEDDKTEYENEGHYEGVILNNLLCRVFFFFIILPLRWQKYP